jgi:ABC-type sugar transport system ATPase subunit
MDGVCKAYAGVLALNHATLEARGGEAVAVMGANGAGKSTLMNILGGVVAADSGRITLDGEETAIRSPRQAAQQGIAFVHQELTMLPTLTVAENIFIDDLPRRGPFIRSVEMAHGAERLLARLGCAISAKTPVEQLGVGDRQLIEIARALRRNARVIIFDEPTSSLTKPERQKLFNVISGLKAEGAVVIYITHFLDEIFTVCERVTVMRNGETVWSSLISDVGPTRVVQLMLGVSENEGRIRTPIEAIGEQPVLSVRRLCREGVLNEIDFEIRRGEIVGLWGLLGSGRTELLHALVGLGPIDGGTIEWNGGDGPKEITPERLRARVGLVTEDRRGEGVLLPLSVSDNVALPNLMSLLNAWRLVDRVRQNALADAMIERLRIKAADREQVVSTLSGGNQQKVVFARWLATSPRLFLLDEPTRGLDVNAKTEILKLVVELAGQGCSVLLVSSELEDLMRVCDRYLIISRGRLVGALPGSADVDALMRSIATIKNEYEAAP